MSEEKVRKWYRDFKNERTNVHDEGWSGRPSKQIDEIVSQVDEKRRSDRRLTISALTDEFTHLGRTTVYTTITDIITINTITSYTTNCVQNGYRKCSPTPHTKRKECSVDDRFWTATDKICFLTLLPETRREYPT